jgi:hypothetical protein
MMSHYDGSISLENKESEVVAVRCVALRYVVGDGHSHPLLRSKEASSSCCQWLPDS